MSDEIKQVICNRSHLCRQKSCSHRVPHEDNCGPSMTCYDDPDQRISMCVPVEGDKYFTYESVSCSSCGQWTNESKKIEHLVSGVEYDPNAEKIISRLL